MTTDAPRPPAMPKNPGERITVFQGFLGKGWLAVTPSGAEHTIKLTVPKEERDKALLLERADGYMVTVAVWLPDMTHEDDEELLEILGLT